MKEKAIRFGKSTTLVGVLTEPRPDRRAPGMPGVVLLNSGILHHIGSCRLHVQIARRLAEAGVTCLRFDHGGVGDSEPRKDTLPFAESAPLEVQEAMDYLAERRKIGTFVLMGLCSGADMAFAVSRRDDRVVGILQMDPYAYRTWKYWVHHYGPRMLQLGRWVSFFKRKLGIGQGPTLEERKEALTPEFETPEYRRKFPPQENVAETLGILCGRDVAIYNIFTGGHGAHYNHRSQYRESFPAIDFRDLLRVDFMPEADHIFTNLDHQAYVTESAATWVTGRWAAEAPAGDTAGAAAD